VSLLPIDGLSPTATDTPYQPSSDTSRDAADRAKAFAGTQASAVYQCVKRHSAGGYGATQREIAIAISLQRSSVAARCNALEKAGLIRKTGARRDGCAVYEAC
jgi:DNA-binding MarR family transcriptional regulator